MREPHPSSHICYIYLFIDVVGEQVWRPGDSQSEAVLSPHCAGPGGQPQVTRLGGQWVKTHRFYAHTSGKYQKKMEGEEGRK